MTPLKHRTASGDGRGCWEYDPVRQTLDVVLVTGNAEHAFTIAVCGVDQQRHGAFPVQRLDVESWRVLPARWSSLERFYIPSAIHEALGHGHQLILTCAPADVDAELEAL